MEGNRTTPVYRHPIGVKTAPAGACQARPVIRTMRRLRVDGEYKIMFRGSMVAVVTPMTADGALDFEALARLVEFHIENGTDAIVAVGTTGESATLDFEEHIQVVRRVVELVRRPDSGDRRHRRQLHRRGPPSDPAGHGGRRRRLPAGHALLQQADPGRAVPALQADRRQRGDSADSLQRAGPHRLRPEAGDGRTAGRHSQHRRHQGSQHPRTHPGPGAPLAATAWMSTAATTALPPKRC